MCWLDCCADQLLCSHTLDRQADWSNAKYSLVYIREVAPSGMSFTSKFHVPFIESWPNLFTCQFRYLCDFRFVLAI